MACAGLPAAPIAGRGMSAPSGRDLLLRGQSEDAWSHQVMQWAEQGGFCGVHVRTSLQRTGMSGQVRRFATLLSIHTRRHGADHDDDDGVPDWLFGREGGPFIGAELKTVTGTLTRDQRRWLHLFNSMPGVYGVMWNPNHADMVRAILVGHDWTLLDQFRVYMGSKEAGHNLDSNRHSGLSIGHPAPGWSL